MIEEYPSYGAVFLAPRQSGRSGRTLLTNERAALVPEAVDERAVAALVVIVDLGAWAFQIPVVV